MLLGLDLGTSSLRAAVVDDRGRILGLGQREYPIISQQPTWAEQDTEEWWLAAREATAAALRAASVSPSDIRAIGLSGQMHGTVLVGHDLQPLAPAVIWADGRSATEADAVNRALGPGRLAEISGNRVSTGFMAATLAWMHTHQPDLLDAARYALLPKDYLRLRMTGVPASEPSDAAATLLFDNSARAWSAPLAEAAGVDRVLLPDIMASTAVAGELTAEAASALGLRAGTPVVAGAGDQAAQAVGNGVLLPDTASSTIGTGGQLLQPLSAFRPDPDLRVHCFCHALPDTWFLMAATLSAGLSLRWWRDLLGVSGAGAYDILSREAAAAGPGAGGLLFLPYLLGERTPYMDPEARGSFVGLSLEHGRGHLARAIMEGVAFSLRDGLEILRGLTAAPTVLVASGGAAKSPLWVQIQTDVFGFPITTVEGEERAVVGAAMLAGISSGLYADFDQAREACVRQGPIVEPDSSRTSLYEELYHQYRSLYPALKDQFGALADIRRSPLMPN